MPVRSTDKGTSSQTPRGASIRERIQAHVRDRILLHGFVQIPVDQIASELAISKKTFYKAYPSKDRLVEDIVEHFLVEIRTSIESIQRMDITALEKFQRVMTLLAQTGSRIGRPFLQDLQRQLPYLWDRIESFRRERIMNNFGQLFDQGMSEGHIRPGINRQVFLRGYIGAVEAIVNPNVLMHESFSAREAIQSILEIFFHGLLTADAGRKLTRLTIRNNQSTMRD